MADPTFKYQRWYTNEHNVINAMRCPDLMGSIYNVGKSSDVIGKVKNNLHDYALAYPIAGKNSSKHDGKTIADGNKGPFYDGSDATLGSNYFVKMGKCSPNSDDGCSGKPRYVYLRNIPKGGKFKQLTGCNIRDVTEGRGLLPGIIDDIWDLLSIGRALGEEDGTFGSTKCKLVKQRVGKNVSDQKMQCGIQNPTTDQLQKCLYAQNRSWWYETRCSPQKEVQYDELFQSDTSTSRGAPHTTIRWWCALGRVLLAFAVLGFVVYGVGEGMRRLCTASGSIPRAFKKSAAARMARD